MSALNFSRFAHLSHHSFTVTSLSDVRVRVSDDTSIAASEATLTSPPERGRASSLSRRDIGAFLARMESEAREERGRVGGKKDGLLYLFTPSSILPYHPISLPPVSFLFSSPIVVVAVYMDAGRPAVSS